MAHREMTRCIQLGTRRLGLPREVHAHAIVTLDIRGLLEAFSITMTGAGVVALAGIVVNNYSVGHATTRWFRLRVRLLRP